MEPGLLLLPLDLLGEKKAVTQSALQGVLGPAECRQHAFYTLNLIQILPTFIVFTDPGLGEQQCPLHMHCMCDQQL